MNRVVVLMNSVFLTKESIILGLLLNAIYALYIWYFYFRGITKDRQISKKLSTMKAFNVEIESDQSSFELLKELIRNNIAFIKVGADHAYVYWIISGPVQGVIGFAALLYVVIVLPIALFYAYSHWLLILMLFIIEFVLSKMLFAIALRSTPKKIMQNKGMFDQAYSGNGLCIIHGTGNAVAYPSQWTGAVNEWSNWYNEAQRIMKTIG